MHKVCFIYLYGELYAYTDDKVLKKQFQSQRIKDFVYKDTSLKEEVFEHMRKTIYNKELYPYTFRTDPNKNEVVIVCTHEEYDRCINKSYEMDDDLNRIYKRQVLQSNYDKKYIDAIEYLIFGKMTRLHRKDGTNDIISNEDMFSILIDTYNRLFEEKEKEE